MKFESFVNSIRCQTSMWIFLTVIAFESFVNSKRCQTVVSGIELFAEFESFANLKGWYSLTFVLFLGIFFQKHFEIGQVRIYPQPAYVLQTCFFVCNNFKLM